MRFKFLSACAVSLLTFSISMTGEVRSNEVALSSYEAEKLEQADDLRLSLIRNPKQLIRKLPRQGETFTGTILSHAPEVSRILVGAFPFANCFEDDITVAAFYNTAHNLWFVTWLDAEGKITEARIATGLELKGLPINSWYSFWEAGATSLASAMQNALQIQINSLSVMFRNKNCPSAKEVDFLFSENVALTGVINSSIEFKRVPLKVRKKIQKLVTDKLSSGADGEEFKITYLQKNVLGMDLFSVSLAQSRPDVYVAQGWRKNESGLELVHSEIFNLMD